MKKLLIIFLVLPLLSLTQTSCENNSNAQQEIVGKELLAVDFLQNISSRRVGGPISDSEYLLVLNLSANTSYMSDLPLRSIGSMNTEKFYENFDINFPEEFPNAMISINEVETPSSIAFEMKNPN